MKRSAEGERLAQSILAQDANSISRQRHAPPPEPVESVPAGEVGQMIFDAREAGAAAAKRQGLEQAVTEAQAKHLLDEYQTVLSGGREPLQAVQRLIGAGNRAGADQLLVALQEVPQHAFSAMSIAGAIQQYESDVALDTAFTQQANEAAKAASERTRIAEARPDLGDLPAAMENAAVSAGEAITPREAAARAQVLRVAEENSRLKESIMGASESVHESLHNEPPYKASLEREVERVVTGSKIAHPGREAELTRLKILSAGDSEANSAELHRARREVEARQSDASAKSAADGRGVGR